MAGKESVVRRDGITRGCATACAFLISVTAWSAFVPGDVDSSGTANAIDVQLVIRAAVHGSAECQCDLNGDNSVTAVDLQIAVNGVLGIPTSQHAPACVEGGPVEDLTITGAEIDNGFFDPSLEWDGKTLWMTYSRVRPVLTNGNVDTQLARSDDHGDTWDFVLELNRAYDDEIGTWHQETSHLVCDPKDPDANAKWKLYWYEWREHGAHSWIAYRSAPSPEGPWSEKEILFAGRFLDPSHTARITVNDLDPSLFSVLAVTEPGVFVDKTGVIYMSLQACGFAGCTQQALLRSTDHNATWTFVSTLVDNTDASALGFENLQATDIFQSGDSVYLLSSPGIGNKMVGLYVFRFEDLASGRLERDETGALIVHQFIDDDNGMHRGAGAYHAQNRSGILFSQFRMPLPIPWFNIEKLNICIP